MLTEDAVRFRHAVLGVAVFLGLLWGIELLDGGLHLHLVRFGVYPRAWRGLWGVLWAPLIHASWEHLLSNSLALAILGIVFLYGYPRASRFVLPMVWLGSGLGVWLFGRASYHLGASGLTHGLMFFVFVSGILRRDRMSIGLSLIVFFLYGGMVWTIFPQRPELSYESHFFGAVMGVIGAFAFRHCDPPLPEKTYDWEGNVADEGPPAGSAWPEKGDDDAGR
jgi:membrane associated rhomboid family serine protease